MTSTEQKITPDEISSGMGIHSFEGDGEEGNFGSRIFGLVTLGGIREAILTHIGIFPKAPLADMVDSLGKQRGDLETGVASAGVATRAGIGSIVGKAANDDTVVKKAA